MKSLLPFSTILFLFVIGVSCSNSDDDPLPNPKPIPSVANIPGANTTGINTLVVNNPVANTPVSTITNADATFKADLKPLTGLTSMASGTATLQLDKTNKIIEINIVFSGLEPFLASIHKSGGGGFVFNFTPYADALYNGQHIPFTSPAHFSSILSDDQIADLNNNQYYLILHTVANVNGEISGTFIKQ